MKELFLKLWNWETVSTVLIALLLGMFLGVMFNSKYSIPLRVKFHDFYVKINPDTQKDSHTLIMEKVTKDAPILPQNSIFDEPEKKENRFIKTFYRIFNKNHERKQTIHDVILN